MKCCGCKGAASGCKHIIAFLFWLHRCSEEPSKTEVSCYWKKPTLSKVGTLEPYEVASQPSSSTAVDGDAFFNSILNKLKNLKVGNQITPYLVPPTKSTLEDLMLHKALHKFKEQNVFEDPELFISFLSSMMSTADCANITEDCANFLFIYLFNLSLIFPFCM